MLLILTQQYCLNDLELGRASEHLRKNQKTVRIRVTVINRENR